MFCGFADPPAPWGVRNEWTRARDKNDDVVDVRAVDYSAGRRERPENGEICEEVQRDFSR